MFSGSDPFLIFLFFFSETRIHLCLLDLRLKNVLYVLSACPLPILSLPVNLCLAKIIKEESADFMKDIKTLKVDLREQTESPHKLSVTPGTSGSSAKKNPSCISDSDSANSVRLSDLEEGERGFDSSDENEDYKKWANKG